MSENYEYLVNKYLKELLDLIRKEFPEISKDDEKLTETARKFYQPLFLTDIDRHSS